MEEPALEWEQRRIRGVARAFREHDQGGDGIERLRHLDDRVSRSRRGVAVDQDGVEDVAADEAPQAALQPVIAAGDRPGRKAQAPRQHRPDQDEIAVAGMIGEINPLLVGRRDAVPAPAHRRDEAGEEQNKRASQAGSDVAHSPTRLPA